MTKRRFTTLSGSGLYAPQDVYGHILYLKDSLALSASQIARLESARKPFRRMIDSMYFELASYLAALPPHSDMADPARRIREVSDSAWKVMHAQGKPIGEILSPVQLHLLWEPVLATLTQPYTGRHWSGPFGSRWE